MSDLKQRARELLHEIQTQDNNMTALLVYYEIHSYRWVENTDGLCDKQVYRSYDSRKTYFGEDEIDKYKRDLIINNVVSEDMVDDYMESNGSFFKYSYEPSIDNSSHIFLTEKEANNFIENNRHHLGEKPFTYVRSGHQSENFKTLIEVLEEYCK